MIPLETLWIFFVDLLSRQVTPGAMTSYLIYPEKALVHKVMIVWMSFLWLIPISNFYEMADQMKFL